MVPVSYTHLNYGLPALAGATARNLEISDLEQSLRQAIIDFEPRILRHTLRVHAELTEERMSHNALTFEVEGDLWAQPVPLQLYLKTEIDLESGQVKIEESNRPRGR